MQAFTTPFADGAFDRVWTQHATMNIAEKERLYVECVDRQEAALASIRAQAAATLQTGPSTSAAQLVLGTRLPDMLRNVAVNLEEDRLTVVQAVFERV